ncbi:phenazine biosynthesis [Phlyctema vagabunda]|uniref:Phenazine biosynthesis n=1 Tax=Phlyctema vagabunda TaxID=108571 RepID=A0ABR4P8S0_9HELO
MKLSFTTIDVFTTTRYAGNPLAIIEVPAEYKTSLTQEQKQKIAAEFNLSETTFLHLPPAGETHAEPVVDIFTTTSELPFAGHPTIGTAHYLLYTRKDPITALTLKAGRFPITNDTGTGIVKADVAHDFHVHEKVFECELATSPAKYVSIVKGMSFILAALPDLAALAKVDTTLSPMYDTRYQDKGWQIGLTGSMYFVSQGQDELGRKKYRTRMLVAEEDPGTGSASCALACWLALQEPKDSGKGPFKYAFTQGVEMGRQNDISLEVTRKDEANIESVVLSGTAVNVMQGTLEI